MLALLALAVPLGLRVLPVQEPWMLALPVLLVLVVLLVQVALDLLG